jgi:hypothetical protein
MNSKRSETLNPIAQRLTVAPQIQLEAATLDVLILPFYMDPISTLITWDVQDLYMSKDYLYLR